MNWTFWLLRHCTSWPVLIGFPKSCFSYFGIACIPYSARWSFAPPLGRLCQGNDVDLCLSAHMLRHAQGYFCISGGHEPDFSRIDFVVFISIPGLSRAGCYPLFFSSLHLLLFTSQARRFFLVFFALIIPLAGLGLVFDEFQGIVHWLHYRGK